MSYTFSRRYRIAAIVGAAALLLYAAFGFLMVPRLVRAQITEFSERHYQRQPTVGAITFNPFTLALEVEDFAFTDSSRARMLAFDRLLVNADLASLWRRGLSLHAIELDRPAVAVVVHTDGSLNLSELGAPFAARPGAPPTADEPLRLFIDRLQLAAGAVQFEDRARSAPFVAVLTPVNFELVDFSTTAGSGNGYELRAASPAGERFRWSGTVALAPLSSRGQFELGAVQARTLWAYLQESLNFEVASGLVDVHGDYHFAASEPQPTMQVGFSRIAVAQLGLRPRGGDADWVRIPALKITDTRVDVASRQVDLGSLALDSGHVRLQRRADGSINLLELRSRSPRQRVDGGMAQDGDSADMKPAGSPPASPPWTVNAPLLQLTNLSIDVDDQFVKPAATLRLTPVNLTLRGFSTTPGKSLALDADIAVENGGRLVVQGTGLAAEQHFRGKLRLESLDLARFQPYVGTYTRMTLLSGTLNSELDVDYRPAEYRVAGSVACERLHTVDNALREDFVRWQRLSLSGIEYRSSPRSLRIANIAAVAPYVRFIIAPDQTTNLAKVLAVPASAPGPVQTVRGIDTSTPRPLAMAIGRIQVENGSADFADFWITPNYAVSLQQLGGTITGLSSRKDSRARLALKGRIDRYAPVEIGGELNLLSASLFTDIRVKFDGVELTSVTPYSGRFAGYRIEKGKLSVDVRYRVENRQLNAEQRFVVDQLTLGDRVDSPDAVKLPLRLAVALLKDRNGVIDLGLPVTGSLDDPKFRLGPIVWKAFVGLLANVATSPFKLLGSVFGGGEEVNLIDFEPGSGALDAAARDKLAALTKALHERPQLALEVPAVYSTDRDLGALATLQLEARLAALPRKAVRSGGEAGQPSSDEAVQRLESLLALYRVEKANAPLPPAVQPLVAMRPKDRDPAAIPAAIRELQAALQPGVDTLQPRLIELAQLRARNIQDALLASGQVEAARVFMLAPIAAPPSGEKVRVALSLK